ncbi:MAG: hydrogenase iron-sulfur subunit [Promethearchaeota archaeon]
MAEESFEPKILFIVCKWCTFAAADLAGSARLQYPPNIRVLMMPCTGKLDLTYIFKAFKVGIDGVVVSGCVKGQCHYLEGNYQAERRVIFAQKILDEIGIGSERLEMHFISASMSTKFQEVATNFTEKIRKLGPLPKARINLDNIPKESASA